MGKSKKAVLHDAGGKKILHPAEAERKKAKQRLRENRAKNRKKRFEAKMLEKDTSDIQAEISEYKEMDKKGKLTKWKKDKMDREVAVFGRLKEKVQENTIKRMEDNAGDQFYVDFDELKVHRKSSIFYDPVKNPYGAPPQGQVLMYRHPDGSVKREPPPLARGSARAAMTDGLVPGHTDVVVPNLGIAGQPDPDQDGESGESEDEEDDDEEDDDDDEPMLPSELPDGTPLPPEPPIGPAPLGAPLPPGPPPGASMPPLPPGAPPLSVLPPMPPGPPPGCGGGFPGPSSGPPGPPMMPKLPCFSGGAAQSQADFAQQMMKMGFMAPPGPPPKGSPPEATMKQRPPGPPNAGMHKVTGGPPGPPSKNPSQGTPATSSRPPGPPPKNVAVGELPPGAKPPPPPPKTAKTVAAAATSAPAAKPLNAATRFMPTTLRTKKPSQVAGGVLQASSASLSQDARKRLLFTEAPKVAEKVNIEDAFQDFMGQLDE